MNELFNNPLKVRPHPTGSGIQRTYKFNNGFGASVVRFIGSYTSNDSEWELAMIQFDEDGDFNLVYNDIVEDDVLGHLSENAVEEVLTKIKQFKSI